MSTNIGILRIQAGQVLIEVPYLVSYDKAREQALAWATQTLEHILANAPAHVFTHITLDHDPTPPDPR